MDIAAFDPLNRLVGLSSTRRLMSLALTPHTSYIYNNLRATVFQTFGLSKNVENELQNTGPGRQKTAPDVKKVTFSQFFCKFVSILCSAGIEKSAVFEKTRFSWKSSKKRTFLTKKQQKNTKKTRKKREKSEKSEKVTKYDVLSWKVGKF